MIGRHYVRASEVRGASFTNNLDCPIARMVKRKHPNDFVSVGPNRVTVGRGRYTLIGGTSQRVQPFIDAGKGFHVTIKEYNGYY